MLPQYNSVCQLRKHQRFFVGTSSVYFRKTRLNALGFKYGDSVNTEFSNGYVLYSIPYYNGYYTDINRLLLIAYPGYEAAKLCSKQQR